MAGGSKSKNKGNGGERELCRIFGDTFGLPFIRSRNSGAFVGGKNAARKEGLTENQIRGQKGDIIPPDDMPHLVIEGKFYKDFRFHQLMQPGPCPQLDEWIGQALDAIDAGDLWMICFKINLRGWYIAIPEEFFKDFAFGNHCVYSGGRGCFKVTDLKDFLDQNRDAIMRLSAQKLAA